jgi:hypothetical protein
LQLARDGRADAAHALKAVERAEGAVGGSVGNDALGERRADERETLDFGGWGAVQVDDKDRRWRRGFG